MPYYVYILYSISLNKYYTGSTANIEERIKRDNAGATSSTKSGRPWKIVFSREFKLKSDALKFESYIKKMKSRQFVIELINSGNAG